MPTKKKIKLALYAGKSAKGFEGAKKDKKIVYGKEDRQPRFEIDDSSAFMTPVKDITTQKTGIPLKSVFQHVELYKNYPELKDIRILLQDENIDSQGNFTGAWDSKKKQLILRRPSQKELLQDPDILKRTLIHELQHLIQDKENFAYKTPKSLFDYDTTPGEMEAYEAEDRMDLSKEDREKYGHTPLLYTKDKKQTVPQPYYTTPEEIESAIKRELDRRLKEKEEMPRGYEGYDNPAITNPPSVPFPRRNVLGVIYPNEPAEPKQKPLQA